MPQPLQLVNGGGDEVVDLSDLSALAAEGVRVKEAAFLIHKARAALHEHLKPLFKRGDERGLPLGLLLFQSI